MWWECVCVCFSGLVRAVWTACVVLSCQRHLEPNRYKQTGGAAVSAHYHNTWKSHWSPQRLQVDAWFPFSFHECEVAGKYKGLLWLKMSYVWYLWKCTSNYRVPVFKANLACVHVCLGIMWFPSCLTWRWWTSVLWHAMSELWQMFGATAQTVAETPRVSSNYYDYIKSFL